MNYSCIGPATRPRPGREKALLGRTARGRFRCHSRPCNALPTTASVRLDVQMGAWVAPPAQYSREHGCQWIAVGP